MNWGREPKQSFKKIKEILRSPKLLIHYDPEKSLVLVCDACPYGLGEVLSHILADSSEKQIAYSSWTISSCEKNYS